jgi:hypothetical protein
VKRVEITIVCGLAALVFVVPGFSAVARPSIKNLRGVGGWIPVTKNVELDGRTSSARLAADAAPVTNPGANLYPRKAQPSDTSFVYPLFPKDALYSYLKLDIQNLVGPVYNDEARSDWVTDTLDNTAAASVIGSVAYGIIVTPNLSDNNPNNDMQTGVYDPTSSTPRKRGHWPGLRIVDGVGNFDQSVFGAGGKENNISTWKIKPGSVGSAKDDITQAYVAETTYRTTDLDSYPTGLKSALMFGIERRANNGTTAYDLEINKLGPTNDFIPNRSVGDILVGVELSSQTSTPPISVISLWDGLKYVPFNITTLPEEKRPVVTTNLIPTPSEPWGFVNAKGVWQVGQIPASCFAEILIPISEQFSLLNAASVGDTTQPLFLQIRSRSSLTDNSDLKDLTTYFPIEFTGPAPELSLRSTCNQGLTYFPDWGSAIGNGLIYRWQFGCDAGSSLTSQDAEFGFDPDAPGDSTRFAAEFTDTASRSAQAVLPTGVDFVDLDVYLTISPGTPTEIMLFDLIRVYRALSATATLTVASGGPHTFNYAASQVGGKAPYTFSWTFYDSDGVVVGTSSTANGTLDVQKSGTYFGVLVVTDTGDLDKDVCTVTLNSNSISFGGRP